MAHVQGESLKVIAVVPDGFSTPRPPAPAGGRFTQGEFSSDGPALQRLGRLAQQVPHVVRMDPGALAGRRVGDGFGRDVVGDAGFVRDCGTFTPGGVGADRSRLPRQARALGGLQVRARTEGGGLGQSAPGADQAG